MFKPSTTQFNHSCIYCSSWKIQSKARTFVSTAGIFSKKRNRARKLSIIEPAQKRLIFEQQKVPQNDWYEISSDSLDEKAAKILRTEFKGSIHKALSTIFPEIDWHPWKFKSFSVPRDYWKDQANQRKFFQDLGNQIGIQTLDDWYDKLSKNIIVEHGGIGLLHRHHNSPLNALTTAFPEHNWTLWKFKSVPDGYWKNSTNLRSFFDDLGMKLNVQTLDDWYEKLSKSVVQQHGGSSILGRKQHSSLIAALMAAYPEHKWIPWKFNQVPEGYWKSKDNVSKFIAELSEKLSIQTLDDWYRVDLKQLHQFGAATLLLKYRGLYRLLKEHYPHHPWDPKRFQQKGKKAQRWLAVTLKKMFPNEGNHIVSRSSQAEILEDYMHPKVMLPSSNRPLQLDVFIPSKSLAFEYQGIQHFQEVGVFGPAKTYQDRDEEKRVLCASNNIKLIEVPYWWNRTQESLQEMIAQ